MINCPRLLIAGLGGDAGKTAVSVGLCRLWRDKGHAVTPFKKGPDYIDMEWLSRGARHPCYNVDLFLMKKDQLLSSFDLNTMGSDIAVVEGNRGLYDGMDLQGSVSTAEIAKLLQIPVILVVDCTKVTRTTAALVLGCQMFDSEVPIKGVILNKLAGDRHEKIIRQCIEHYCHLPVVGAIPKVENITFPGRHLGLIPPQEHPESEEAIQRASEIMREHLDINKLWQIAQNVSPLPYVTAVHPESVQKHVTIGVIRDSAFQFYYPENLDALKRAGAELIEFSALADDLPSSLNALYIGGGFPETHAEALSGNERLRKALKNAAEEGLPIYAECGGLMYLSEELLWGGNAYPMVGILPAVIAVSRRPRGHGYTVLEVDTDNPFFRKGQILRGHEFHYSYIARFEEKEGVSFVFRMKKGEGISNGMDGLCYKSVLATYSHLHALGANEWINGLISAAAASQQKNLSVN